MLGLIAAAIGGCDADPDAAMVGLHPPPTVPLTAPTQLCRARGSISECRDARQAEKLLARADLEIVDAARPPAGIQGARVLTLRAPTSPPTVFRAKWRAHATTTSRNSPRRELAAYAVQKLFLDPDEYVVPPTAPHCFALDMFRREVDRGARATFDGVPCVYGILSYWLEDVQSLEDAIRAGWFDGKDNQALDPELFERNRAYRDSIADVNLFTVVIAHVDGHPWNFLLTLDARSPRVYSIDNSLSLGLPRNRRLASVHDWSRIRVPALRRASVDRLREASDQVDDLGVVAVLAVDDRRFAVTGRGDAGPVEQGTDRRDDRLIVGLTRSEIAGVRQRIAALLEQVDRGQIRTY